MHPMQDIKSPTQIPRSLFASMCVCCLLNCLMSLCKSKGIPSVKSVHFYMVTWGHKTGFEEAADCLLKLFMFFAWNATGDAVLSCVVMICLCEGLCVS